ncbi:MAG: hypothetical protein KF830_15230 [Planctomycetes bacterium]|nr:hypothetical protein [Planctomycetota bacterium]
MLMNALSGKKVVVDGSSAEEWVFELGEPVSPVEIVVHYPTHEVLCPIVLSLRNEKGRGPAIANYRPERGVIRRWLTGSSVTVDVKSIAYRELHHPATELSPAKVTRIDIHLVEK